MAASTITRTTFTDGVTPWNASELNSSIYDKIDQMFGGAGTYATFELGGALKINGALTQLGNDGGALGTSSLGWSDLFLASGAVVNFASGDVTITHAANALEFAGASSGYTFNGGPVGIGVTLKTWGAGFSVLELQSGALYANSPLFLYLAQGLYSDGTDIRYQQTDDAPSGLLRLSGGAILFQNAPAGTADDVATLTSRLAIESTGTIRPGSNDGAALGTSSASWSDLFLASGGVVNFANGDVTITHSSNTLTFAGAASGYVFNDGVITIVAGTAAAPALTTSGDLNTGVFFPAADTVGFATAGSERLRITSGGLVGINQPNPTEPLHVVGTTRSTRVRVADNDAAGPSFAFQDDTDTGLFRAAADSIGFAAGGTERMRLSGDELWIGYTTDQGAYKLQVNSQIFATNATIATSDARFKTDVQPVADGLGAVRALKPVAFRWKPHPVHHFIAGTDVGFLAQDVQQALAGRAYVDTVVTTNGTGKDEFLGMADSKLIPLLVAAVQELAAKVDALTAH